MFKLATLAIDFVGRGAEALRATFGDLKAQADKFEAGVRAAGKSGDKSLAQLTDSIRKVEAELKAAERAAKGFGGASVAEMGRSLEEAKRLKDQLAFLRAEQAKAQGPAAPTLKGKIGEQLKKVSEGIKEMKVAAQGVQVALGAATLGVLGFAKAGFAGTTHMGALEAQMTRLSRGVAGIFVPEMNKLIELIQRGADWLHNLSGEQQRQIAYWVKIGAAALAVSLILPKVITIGGGVVTVLKSMSTAVNGLNLVLGGGLVGTIAKVVLAVGGITLAAREAAGAFGEMNVGVDEFTSKRQKLDVGVEHKHKDIFGDEYKSMRTESRLYADLKAHGFRPEDLKTSTGKPLLGPEHTLPKHKPHKDRTDVIPQVPGPESITATIQRLQQASLKQDFAKEQTGYLKELAQFARELREKGLKPPNNPNDLGNILAGIGAKGVN